MRKASVKMECLGRFFISSSLDGLVTIMGIIFGRMEVVSNKTTRMFFNDKSGLRSINVVGKKILEE